MVYFQGRIWFAVVNATGLAMNPQCFNCEKWKASIHSFRKFQFPNSKHYGSTLIQWWINTGIQGLVLMYYNRIIMDGWVYNHLFNTSNSLKRNDEWDIQWALCPPFQIQKNMASHLRNWQFTCNTTSWAKSSSQLSPSLQLVFFSSAWLPWLI